MIRQQNIKENARSRRDARRKAKQEAFARANPMLVGRKYDVDTTPVEIESRPGYEPAPIKFVAQDAIWQREEYKRNLERATIVYGNELRAPVERKNRRIWYRDANPLGNKIHAVQRQRGKSMPVYFD